MHCVLLEQNYAPIVENRITRLTCKIILLSCNAVSKLDRDTETGRRKVYENARITFTALLKRQKPPLSEADIVRHQLVLESAIHQVERKAASNTKY